MFSKKKKECVECFGILADRTRLRIIRNLQGRSINVSGITEAVGVTQPTVSHHLHILDTYGFLLKEKKGRETYYTFNPQYPCKGCGVFSLPIR